MKTAIVVGHQGQDGQLMSDFLTSRNYHVLGIGRTQINLRGEFSRLTSKEKLCIDDPAEVSQFIREVKPDEVYHLAAYHHSSEDRIAQDLQHSDRTYRVNVFSLLCFLEAIRLYSPSTRIFYASSSHIFGHIFGRDFNHPLGASGASSQNETTPINPNSHYGISKAAGVFHCRTYRETHGVFASAGILYNHESRYRKENFVSKKIIRGAIDVYKNRQEKLYLGSLDTQMDWGYAPDYVDAMHRILQLDVPDDFVIATGQLHSVLEFVKIAFGLLGLNWQNHVQEDPSILTRGVKPLARVGDTNRLFSRTGWVPRTGFKEMIGRLLEDEISQQGLKIRLNDGATWNHESPNAR